MASSTPEQDLRMSGPEEEEKEKLRGQREKEKGAQEGSSAAEDTTFSGQKETTHSDKEKECLVCQSLTVPVKDLDPQVLSALDSSCTSSPGDGASGQDQDGNRELPAHGGENKQYDSVGPNQEWDNSDLDVVWRDQTPVQNEENPNNTPNSKNAENQENQGAEQCDPKRSVPIVMITNLEETKASAEGHAEGTAESVKQEGTESADANLAASPGDVTDFSGSDLQSLKSDTLSLLSGTTVSSKSDEQEGLEEDTRSVAALSVMDGLEEDTRSVATSSIMEGPEEDTRSVTASSVMSLFQRMQMDPLEREWLRCAALGNAPGLRQLLLQDPTLAPKKTALHWAAKQGRIETVDMMARSGADVNQRAGYTPLHLASLHGHAHIIQLLINNYNAKVNIRDYHGKMATHYWNGSMDVFNTAGSQSGGKWSRGRRGQRYGQFSALLSRSRSQGNLNVELLPGSLELTPRLLPRSETNIQTLMDTF